MGASPPIPPGKIKRFKPSLLSAFREQQGGQEKRKAWGLFAPKPPTRMSVGRNGHDGSAGASPDPLLLVPGPYSGRITHQIRRNLGSYVRYNTARQRYIVMRSASWELSDGNYRQVGIVFAFWPVLL